MERKIFIRPLVALASIVMQFSAFDSRAATNDITQAIEAIRKNQDLPALAVVVTKDGQICDRVAVGVRKWGDSTPVTTNDVFHIGSCTKSMTATLTAILIEEGKLRWDTTIAEVFPELRGRMDKQYESVTPIWSGWVLQALTLPRCRCSCIVSANASRSLIFSSLSPVNV